MSYTESARKPALAYFQPAAGSAVAAVLAAIFVVAAVGKLYDIFPILTLVRYLTRVTTPSAWTVALVTLLITWEFLLALLLLSYPHSRLTLWSTTVTLTAFTLVLIRLWFAPDAPSCGCFAFLHNQYVGRAPVPPEIIRNLLMLAAVGFIAMTHPNVRVDSLAWEPS